MDALPLFQAAAAVVVLPLLGQRGVDAPRHVHQHGTRRGGINGAHEALGLDERVEVRHEGQPRHIAGMRAGRISAEYQIGKRHLFCAAEGCLGCRVLPCELPRWQRGLEEVDEMLLGLEVALCAGHAGDQYGRQELALVYVEVVPGGRDAAQVVVSEGGEGGGRGCAEHRKEDADEHGN